MKKFKKMMAIVLSLAVVLAFSVPVTFAAKGDTHTISVDSEDTHTYDVYQILIGDLSDGTLSNVEWGSSVNTPTEGKINGKTATEFAKSLEGLSGVEAVTEVGKYFTEGTGKVGQVKEGSSLTVAEGYYVMVDVTDPLKHDDYTDTKALNVIKLNGDVKVEKKWSTTTDVKTIVADTLGKDEGENTYDPGVDNDNVSVGDTVSFNIAATVPENADKFKEGTFFFVITDTLSDGLTFTEGSIEVYDGETKLAANKYTVQYDVNDHTFEIGLIDAASYKGHTINVTYKAVLNKDAVIGEEGNPNTSTVQFSNDPNKTYDGTPEDEDYPGFPDSTQNVPTGETPESKTITYTTGIEIQKVDEEGKPLTGATFEISGTSTKTVLTVSESFEAANDGDYYKLKNGKYTKEAPSTDPIMKQAEAGATAGYVVDASYTGEDKVVVDGTTYRPYVPETDEGKTIYVLVNGNQDQYEDGKYKKVVGTKTENTATDHKVSAAVDANGIVRFDGLGAGTYTIKETVTPEGYNTIPDQTVVITFNEDGTTKWSTSSTSTAYDATEGIFKIEIVNQTGSELPSTGGIGTTIFYVLGALLVVGAGVLLVTRRRMKTN